MPKFVIFVHATADSEAGKLASPEQMADMGKLNTELINAGAMVDAAGLLRSAEGARVQFSDAEPEVQNGPFPLGNLVSGYWILKLDGLDDAIGWAKKIPFKKGSVEIRRVLGPEDFAEARNAELKA